MASVQIFVQVVGFWHSRAVFVGCMWVNMTGLQEETVLGKGAVQAGLAGCCLHHPLVLVLYVLGQVLWPTYGLVMDLFVVAIAGFMLHSSGGLCNVGSCSIDTAWLHAHIGILAKSCLLFDCVRVPVMTG